MGCPIRKSPDQRLFGTSPELIAAYHALHRLREPRHPPCALIRLLKPFNYYQYVEELLVDLDQLC